MKKSVLVLVLAGLSVLMISSCASSMNNFVFDDSIPTEQLVELQFLDVGTTVGYNGINVDWRSSDWYVYTVKIPAGDTLLEINVETKSRNTNYFQRGSLFRYNFRPNMKYSLRFGTDEGITGLNVFTFEGGENMPAKLYDKTDPHFAAFVPFLNAQGSQKTVLE